MNDTFGTENFDQLCQFIKPLLDTNHDVRICVDCEGVYMVDYVDSNFTGERFCVFDEETFTLDGLRINFGKEDE